AALRTEQDEAALRETEERIAREAADLEKAREAAEERATVLAAEAEDAWRSARLESDRRQEAEAEAATRVAELETARLAAEQETARMAGKARKVAQVAREEVARLRMERKALEQAVARRGAELAAVRQSTAQEVERRRDAELQRAVETAARLEAERAAQQVSVDRARQEVAEADANKAAAAAAEATEREAEARRTAEEDELEAVRKRRRERWTNGARRTGNVAASIGIVAVAVFGADRIFQLPDSTSQVPAAAVRTVPVAQPAEAKPPEEVPADSLETGPVDESLELEQDLLEADATLPVVLAPDFESGVPGVEEPDVVPSGVDPRLLDLDALADSADGAMVFFRSLAVAFETGAKGCGELKSAYVEVDSRWVAYVVNGVSRMDSSLDAGRTTRHKDLTREKQRVEMSYEVSGCPVP
ncbi:hypothetical protein ACFL5T_01910, partial [Gemmatimonadota bacterium]